MNFNSPLKKKIIMEMKIIIHFTPQDSQEEDYLNNMHEVLILTSMGTHVANTH